MSSRIVLATRNKHKVVEVRRILKEAGFSVDLVGIEDLPGIPEVAETGATFAENALLKARAVAHAAGFPAIADDSGLCLDVLGGMPGIFSARWAGRHGNDASNLALVLAQLVDVSDDRRGASFVCAAAVALPTGQELVEEGTLAGRVVREPRGSNGFGYDPIFVPDGDSRTTAEMSAVDKDAMSHRGRAFRALARRLPELLTYQGS